LGLVGPASTAWVRGARFASIVASDAMPLEWPDRRHDTREWPLPAGASTHPRTSGTFARSLRLMVLEHRLWSWAEAFRRCSYLPARVLDEVAPAMRSKGLLAPGADADLVVLDPATLTGPTRPSAGVRHLMVGGTFVIRGGALDLEAYPGRAVRGVVR
jgi:N-acyl-D-aspartate/D-glutamate deacylase